MSLVTRNGSLLLRNGLLGTGQSCCCTPLAVTSCTECCPFLGTPEIPVRVALSISQLLQETSTGSNQPIIFAATNSVSYEGVLLLNTITSNPQCDYFFAACGNFGELFYLDLLVSFKAISGVCVPEVVLGGYYRTCFNAGQARGSAFLNQICNCFSTGSDRGFVGSFLLRTNRGSLGVGASVGYFLNGFDFDTGNGGVSNVVENRPAMTSPCQFSSSVSFSYINPIFLNFRFASSAPSITNDCLCGSIDAGSEPELIQNSDDIGGIVSGQASLLVETL
jgi:hypothetical protein